MLVLCFLIFPRLLIQLTITFVWPNCPNLAFLLPLLLGFNPISPTIPRSLVWLILFLLLDSLILVFLKVLFLILPSSQLLSCEVQLIAVCIADMWEIRSIITAEEEFE